MRWHWSEISKKRKWCGREAAVIYALRQLKFPSSNINKLDKPVAVSTGTFVIHSVIHQSNSCRLKSHPSTHRNLTTSKKGAKGSVGVYCLPSAKHKRGTFTKARQTTCWSWTWRDSISLWSRSLFSLLFQIFIWMEPTAFVIEWEPPVTSNLDTYEINDK